MKTLILFSTRDGQTHEIAKRIAGELSRQHIDSDLFDIRSCAEPEWAAYQCVVIGASIRYGHFHSAFTAFVEKYADKLNALPTAFFSVNLVARKPEKNTPMTNAYTRKFLAGSSWQPSVTSVFAGALRYPRYCWCDRLMIRLIMKMTGGETDVSKEVEYTNWQRVTEFTQEIAYLSGKKC